MEITELMIGDWVFNKFHKKNIKLTAYDFFTHGHDENGLQRLNQFSRPALGRDLEPIPLAGEILEKNGFKEPSHQQPTGYYLQKIEKGLECWDMVIHLRSDSLCQVTIEHSEDDVVGSLIYAQEIHHVHQLQHTLRLCGLSELADNFKLEEGGEQ